MKTRRTNSPASNPCYEYRVTGRHHTRGNDFGGFRRKFNARGVRNRNEKIRRVPNAIRNASTKTEESIIFQHRSRNVAELFSFRKINIPCWRQKKYAFPPPLFGTWRIYHSIGADWDSVSALLSRRLAGVFTIYFLRYAHGRTILSSRIFHRSLCGECIGVINLVAFVIAIFFFNS